MKTEYGCTRTQGIEKRNRRKKTKKKTFLLNRLHEENARERSTKDGRGLWSETKSLCKDQKKEIKEKKETKKIYREIRCKFFRGVTVDRGVYITTMKRGEKKKLFKWRKGGKK